MNTGSPSSRIRPIWVGVLLLVTSLVVYLVLRPSGGDDTSETARVEPLSLDEESWWVVETVQKPRSVDIQGRLRAEQRLELFPEIPGRVALSNVPFREGVRVQQGDPILQLEDREARLELYALRSAYQNLVASLLPDVKLDHPESLSLVEAWLDAMDPETTMPEIPDVESSQLRRFLASRGVYERYYQIRSAEERLEKFSIRAPFSGVITSARVEPGQSVGPQTHAGSFLDPTRYRLTVMVRPDEVNMLEVGMPVELRDESERGRWTGTISRMVPIVDSRTQSVEVHLSVHGDGLREGAYLRGTIETGGREPLAEIPVSALRRDGSVYRVGEDEIVHHDVEVVSLERESVWVRGLTDGDRILRSAQKVVAGRQLLEVSP